MQKKPISNYTKGVLLLIASLTVLAGAIIAPSLPSLVEHWVEGGMEQDQAHFWGRMLLSIPALSMLFFSPLMGYIVDRFGRLKVLFTGLSFYAITGICGGIAPTLEVLVISRILLGIAVSMTMTSAMTLAGDYLEGVARQRFFGMFGSAMSFGGIIYFIAGGIAADYHWRAPFFIYLFAFIPLVMAFFAFHEPDIKKQEEEHDHRDQRLNIPVIILLYLTAMMNMGMYYIVPMQLPFVLQEIGNGSALYTGLFSACCSVGVVLMSFQYHRVRKSMNPAQVFSAGFLLLGLGYMIFSHIHVLGVMAAGLFISGCGLGLIIPNSSTWIMGIAPARYRGRIMGGLTSSINLGQVLSPVFAFSLQKAYGNVEVYSIFGIAALVVALFYILFSKHKSVRV